MYTQTFSLSHALDSSHPLILFKEVIIFANPIIIAMLNSTENPFILMKVQGYPCQKVCGAQLTEVEITTGADIPLEEGVNSAIEGTIKPDGTTSNQRVQMRYCYYQRKDYGLYSAKYTGTSLLSPFFPLR